MAVDMSVVDHGKLPDPGHLLSGIFGCAFGLAFLLLTVVRMNRLMGRFDASVMGNESALHVLLQQFLENHVPERNPVLGITGKAIVASTVFGITYEFLKARLSHMVNHLTVLILFFFVGWCALLESKRFLPGDSFRAALAVALWGEALAWIDHGMTKFVDDVKVVLHLYLGLISGLTALSATVSVLRGSTSSPVASFCFYLGVPLGMVLQGCWFLSISYNMSFTPIPSTRHATGLLVVELLALMVLCQLVGMIMVLKWRRQEGRSGRSLSTYSTVRLKDEYGDTHNSSEESSDEEEDNSEFI